MQVGLVRQLFDTVLVRKVRAVAAPHPGTEPQHEAKRGGRPPGEPINVVELEAWRGTASKKAFARTLPMGVNTLAQILKTGRASTDSKKKIDAYRRKKSPRKHH